MGYLMPFSHVFDYVKAKLTDFVFVFLQRRGGVSHNRQDKDALYVRMLGKCFNLYRLLPVLKF